MRNQVKITMKNGKVHYCEGYASTLIQRVRASRSYEDTLIELESTAIPTGQMFYIDATEVQSVEDDRW